jgi:hypothetical protein
MKYLVTNHFGRGSDWTPERLAAALKGPLGQLGVTVELTRAPVSAGFQAVGLSADAYKRKHDEVGRVVRQVMSAGGTSGDAVTWPQMAERVALPSSRERLRS